MSQSIAGNENWTDVRNTVVSGNAIVTAISDAQAADLVQKSIGAPATVLVVDAVSVPISHRNLQQAVSGGLSFDASGAISNSTIDIGADTAANAASLQSVLGLTTLNSSIDLVLNSIATVSANGVWFGNTVGTNANVITTIGGGLVSSKHVIADALSNPGKVRISATATNVTAGSETITFDVVSGVDTNTGVDSASSIVASGTETLVAGTITVSTQFVQNLNSIFICRQSAGGVLGFLSVGGLILNGAFDINSSNAGDTSVVNWMIVR